MAQPRSKQRRPKGRRPIIDPVKLDQLLQQGKTQKECSQFFGVSEAAISKAMKKLSRDVARVVGIEKAAEVVESRLDIMGQLKQVNETILNELDRAQGIIEGPGAKDIIALQEIIIKLSAEVRKQGDQYLRAYEVWCSLDHMAAFQNEVLAVLEEAIPGKRDEIIDRLKQSRSLRSVVNFDS